MKKTLLASVPTMVFGLASAAPASVYVDFVVTEPTLTGMPGWVGGTIRLTSTQGVIGGFDFGGTDPVRPSEANKGIFGELHQRWFKVLDEDRNDTGDRTPTPTAGSAGN